MTVFGKTNWLARKTNFFFIALLLPFMSNEDVVSKFEANLALRLRVKHASFSLASLCSNDYFRTYAIIDFLANQLVFLNTVTHNKICNN